MALVPRALRPTVLIRRKAIYSGFLGPSTFWKVVGGVMFGRSTIKKVFGRNEEVVDVSSLGPGRFLQLITAEPTTRRERKRLRKQGVWVPTLDEQTVLAQRWADDQVRAKGGG